MDEKDKQTQRLEIHDADMLEALLKQSNRELGTARLSPTCEVILLIGAGIRRLELRNESSYLIGRFNKSKPRGPHLDLSPFNATERGVSRIHAQIHMEDDHVYLTDMDSTNGTKVDGVKLIPHQQYQLRHNSDVRFGQLPVQVLYKTKQVGTEWCPYC